MSLDVICGKVIFPLEKSWNCFCFSLRCHDRTTPASDRFVMVSENGKVVDFDYEVSDRQLNIKKAVSNLHNCLSQELLKRDKEYDDVMSLIFPITQDAALGKKPLTLENIDRVNYIMMNVLHLESYNSE